MNPNAGHRTIQKVRRRIIPFVVLLFFVCYLDRINIGFAALTMNHDLGITSREFGLISGIFFFGYFLFEIPSNLLLQRIGARIWIARILIVWGMIATATGFVHNVRELFAARFLLGLAEAGYFPGMVLYLTYWLPQREQARAVALLAAGAPIVSILGAPVSGLILDHIQWFGLAGWRWVLILQALPAIALGFLTYFVLPDNPRHARFLTPEEKAGIEAELAAEARQKEVSGGYSVSRTLTSVRVWHLAATYFGMMIGVYTVTLWTPQLVKVIAPLYSNLVVGLLVMIPNLTGLAAMILVSRNSDRMLERRLHVAIPLLVAAATVLLLSASRNPFYCLILLSVLAACVYSYTAPFWALPNQFLTGYSAAAGIALINSVGNLGGFAGPYTIGLIAEKTGILYRGLAVAAIALLFSAALVMRVAKHAHASRDRAVKAACSPA
jgi:ACS family tartrate transporter-like MFS transporter